jgi:group I intron endonuclease
LEGAQAVLHTIGTEAPAETAVLERAAEPKILGFEDVVIRLKNSGQPHHLSDDRIEVLMQLKPEPVRNGLQRTSVHSIYCAVCLANGKLYVGQTRRSVAVRRCHAEHESREENLERAFPKALKKYGTENFAWFVIGKTDDDDEAAEMETALIHQLGTLLPEGYNMIDGRRMSAPDVSLSERVRAENLRRWADEDQRARIIESLRRGARRRVERFGAPLPAGRQLSEEHRQRISEQRKGKAPAHAQEPAMPRILTWINALVPGACWALFRAVAPGESYARSISRGDIRE